MFEARCGNPIYYRTAPVSFSAVALKGRHLSMSTMHARYMDSRLILFTSNICKRVMSLATIEFGNNRCGRILTVNVEQRGFLNFRGSFWGSSDVSQIIK